VIRTAAAFDFELPRALEAHEPPEARGLSRDDVRLMVAYRHDGSLVHARFRELARFLERGDLLVINTSRTLPASLPARRGDGTELELHLSTPLPCDQQLVDLARDPVDPQTWVVELRKASGSRSMPFRDAIAGETLTLPGATAEILGAFSTDCDTPGTGPARLWTASLRLPISLGDYLQRHGHAIRYDYSAPEWPVSYYQTVYATDPGSAEMPSAGRAFTPEMITELIARGIDVAPLTLHTGVSSLEDDEPPPAEYFDVPDATAHRIAVARAAGARVVAVGTTVVRALETVGETGTVRAGRGWSDVVISPDRGVRAVDGLLTGWHEPRASHLMMLEAVAGRGLLEESYRAALDRGYLWHEFGDLHLILP
jgi:S-adenosylmethionine:tRNA ribosyltransferase-isomerase